MTGRSLTVSARAEAEIAAAARWYERESAGLGAAFLEVLDQTLQGIEEGPLRFTVVHRDVRRALLKRFPFGVFFRMRPRSIRVIAVVHLARDPERWKRRS